MNIVLLSYQFPKYRVILCGAEKKITQRGGYDSVFDIEPRLVIDEAKAEQELNELGEEMDVYLAHRLPPYPASDPVVYTREDEDMSESSDDEEMDEKEEEEKKNVSSLEDMDQESDEESDQSPRLSLMRKTASAAMSAFLLWSHNLWPTPKLQLL